MRFMLLCVVVGDGNKKRMILVWRDFRGIDEYECNIYWFNGWIIFNVGYKYVVVIIYIYICMFCWKNFVFY